MANMGYCRFENTLLALRDCHEVMGTEDDAQSQDEKNARFALIKLCKRIAEENE